jgi:putative oxygen-independent coproporphyrinogen III oxidase
LLHFSTSIPLTLYVHMPWCIRKCPYCDFNSHEARKTIPEKDYIDALLLDLEQDIPRIEGRRIESIFIGGGTPSLFSAASIQYLLQGLHARLDLQTDLEITLEANPGTVEQQKFQEFREVGINRLSIGIQSFNDEHLRRLGRIHDRGQAIQAAETAHRAGFNNFNLDLMFGLPGQSPEQAMVDIVTAISLQPTHISHYQLTLEPNTLFYKHPPVLPNDDLLWEMQSHCQAYLAEKGYTQYEVSAYTRGGWRCHHNLNYWEFGDYLGIGAGVHAKISDALRGNISRLWKLKHPRDYLRYAGGPRCIGGHRLIPEEELVVEFMMNALRLTDGFPAELFVARTGLPFHDLEPLLVIPRERGLLKWQEGHIKATSLGQRFLNDLLLLLMPENDSDARFSHD